MIKVQPGKKGYLMTFWHVLCADMCSWSLNYSYVDGVTQQTRGIHPMLFQCWPTVIDAGPTLKQRCVNVPLLPFTKTTLSG